MSPDLQTQIAMQQAQRSQQAIMDAVCSQTPVVCRYCHCILTTTNTRRVDVMEHNYVCLACRESIIDRQKAVVLERLAPVFASFTRDRVLAAAEFVAKSVIRLPVDIKTVSSSAPSSDSSDPAAVSISKLPDPGAEIEAAQQKEYRHRKKSALKKKRKEAAGGNDSSSGDGGSNDTPSNEF